MRNIIEKTFVVLALLFFSDALLSLIQNPNRDNLLDDATASEPVRAAVALSLYLILFAFGLLKYKAIVDAVRSSKLLFSLIALAVVSASWSPEPAASAKRAVLLLATTLFGVYFAVRFEPFDQLKLISLTMAIAIVAGIALALGIPAYGRQAEMDGAWRGIFSHKNAFGRMAVLSTIVFFFMSRQARSRTWFWCVAIALAIGSVVLSRSAAAVVVLVAVGVWLITLSLFRLPKRLLIPAACLYIAFATGAAALASANMDFLFASLGRDATLTGRTEIWSALEGPISKHLWFGYGYGGFWLGPGSESESVVEQVAWAVKYAHNGFLDLALQLGVTGVTIFTLLFLTYLIRALRLARTQTGYFSLWPSCYLAFVFFYNFSDNTIIAHNNLFWVLFVGISLSISRMAARPYRTTQTRILCRTPPGVQTLAQTCSLSTQNTPGGISCSSNQQL